MAHDMKWSKVQVLGKGSYGTVHLAMANRVGSAFSSPFSGLIAIKSAVFQNSLSLQKEAKILQDLVDCPEIVHYFGNNLTIESGVGFYNLQLEYASGGTLEDLIKKTGGKLVEYDVQRYTRMIVKGLRCIHEKGYVHCDLKPANILVFRSKDGKGNAVKIADFGISKIPREENGFVKRKFCFRGTPIYMSPESVALGEIEAPLDIWSLGCTVIEMITGKHVWNCTGLEDLMFQIVFGKEPPKIPETMSEHGKDFLRKCFVRDPRKRWTAEMLLNHPFISETECFTSTKIRLIGCSSSISRGLSSSETLLPPPGFSAFPSVLHGHAHYYGNWQLGWGYGQ
ncbi:hypothetical protein RGQ29_013365 [Quercus rubra]|uniref:Protein kinase domain-containing protein n=1 Tax=Quercus rubra TaxID=3512 RepID=A0AAN7GAS6_QUERU|nr:hypothetical protein RGQ29_013365 [Quercus rubra]